MRRSPDPLTTATPTRRGTWRELSRRFDSYTLWAFNPQPPLAPPRTHGSAPSTLEGASHVPTP